MKEQKNYYSKVVNDFLNYREYKRRCEYIEETEDIPSWVVNSLIGENAGIDYTKEKVQSSNKYDPTSSPVLEAAADYQKEYFEKKQLVDAVEKAYKGLNPLEQFIMEKKYMTGRIVPDKQIYTHPNFQYGKTKYYEIKNSAVEKAARIIGYIKEKSKKLQK